MQRKKDNNELACTALRSVANANMYFYVQADKKAQILIRANALMMSVLLNAAIEPTEFHRLAIIPIAGQLFFSIVVIMLSLHSTQPGSAPPRPSGERTVDVLHFLAHERLEKDEYLAHMKNTLGNADRLYPTLTRDIYYQSQVLARKYRYLTLAFNVFIIGLGLNILAVMIITI